MTGRTRALLVLLFAGVVVACGGDRGGWSGTMTDSAGVILVSNPARADWQLVAQPAVDHELRIGALDGSAEYQFGMIAGVDVAPDGRIFVLDQQAAQVRVFDAQGTFVQSLGRPGAGPGELSAGTAAIMVGGGDTLYVADMMKQRIHRYAPDGSDAGGVAVPIANGLPIAWAIAPQRRFVTQVRPLNLPGARQDTTSATPRDLILLRDAHGEIVDTLLSLESGRTMDFSGGGMPRMRLFEPEPVWTLLTDGRIVHGRNDRYRLEVLDTDGGVERVITRPFERAPVTETDRTAFIRLLRETMQAQVPPQMLDQFLQRVEFADSYPAFSRILGGPDNSIWVQHVLTADAVERAGGTFNAQDIGAPDWDIFDAEGRLLGTLRMPDRFQPLRVIGNHVYGVQRDDLDVQYVVRLRIGRVSAAAQDG
jgi:hypothetical protein